MIILLCIVSNLTQNKYFSFKDKNLFSLFYGSLVKFINSLRQGPQTPTLELYECIFGRKSKRIFCATLSIKSYD